MKKEDYNGLVSDIGKILDEGRKQVYYTVNNLLVKTYWEIGKQIVEYEQRGKEKPSYGDELLLRLSKDLKIRFGKGFSKSNVYLMREFYLKYSKFQTVSGKLSWSHYAELLGIEDDLERGFYEKQTINERWSVRELVRQKNSALFYRIALSKDKKGVLELSKKGQVLQTPDDLIKDPYVLEFLKIPHGSKYSEKDVEQGIIDNLQMFLLELGKGFAFVGRQYKINIGAEHYYIDLVFYHRILKCFVLIDLKIGGVNHLDVGQMNMYLNYFKDEENSNEDNPPIGLVLSAEKNNILVKYALGSITNNLFVSKYKLYFPDKKELENQLKKSLK